MKRKQRSVLWIILGVALLTLIALAVWVSSDTPKTPRASEAWSRGYIVGQTPVKRRATLRAAVDGGVFLVWSNLDGRLELARIGAHGEVLLVRVLPVDTKRARDPQLHVARDGRLHLLWREEGEAPASVRYALLEADGTPLDQPKIVSGPASRVSDAPRLVSAEGYLHALWVEDAGIYWAVLDQAGNVLEGPTLLIPGGEGLVVQVDEKERLHLVWQQESGVNTRTIHYGVLDPGQEEMSYAEEIAELVLTGRLRLEDLALGLDSDAGYVFWSDYDQAFDRYRFQVAVLPLDAPQRKRVDVWQLRMGDGPLSIAPVDGQRTPLQVALSERMFGSRQTMELQIAVITVGQEEEGEQVVTASSHASVKPVLIADDRSYLHMAWLDTAGFGRYQVVYASTAPEVMENYNALTLGDAVNAVFSNVFRLSTVLVSMVASLSMWAVVPLVGLVIYHLTTSEETLETGRSWVALGMALAVEVALTFALPPRIGVEATWSSLRWIVPSVTAALTAALTAIVARRRGSAHLFAMFFLFTMVNSLLQLALYVLL